MGTDGYVGFLYDIQTQALTTLQYAPNTYTNAFAINDVGTIAGRAFRYTGYAAVAFKLDGTTYTTIRAPGNVYTGLTAINNFGVALGESETHTGIIQFFLLDQGKLAKLSIPPGFQPVGINDTNAIVGTYGTPGTDEAWGFVQQNNTRHLLRFPGSSATWASGINSAGQVVGSYSDAKKNIHGFIWTPPADPEKK